MRRIIGARLVLTINGIGSEFTCTRLDTHMADLRCALFLNVRVDVVVDGPSLPCRWGGRAGRASGARCLELSLLLDTSANFTP
jgi:hypothetical protein